MKSKKPSLKKFKISKLENMREIVGGATDNGQGDTVTGGNHTKTTKISSDTDCPDQNG